MLLRALTCLCIQLSDTITYKFVNNNAARRATNRAAHFWCYLAQLPFNLSFPRI